MNSIPIEMLIGRDAMELIDYPSAPHQSGSSEAGAQKSGLKRPDPVPKLLPLSSRSAELMTNLCILMDAITPPVHSCGSGLSWPLCATHKLPALFICRLVITSLWGLGPRWCPRGLPLSAGWDGSLGVNPTCDSLDRFDLWRFISLWSSPLARLKFSLTLLSELFFNY